VTDRPALLIKICGIRQADVMVAALDAGADMVGLVFHPRSPRAVDLQTAADLAEIARGRAQVVALTVDMGDEQLAALADQVQPDALQLHGQETPARVSDVRTAFGRPVVKAVGVAEPADLAAIPAYAAVADLILIDAKPPAGAQYPGGHGRSFDWTILSQLDPKIGFMLSGGLTSGTVAAAIARTQPLGVDVSSGVETAPGEKTPALVRGFIAEARRAQSAMFGSDRSGSIRIMSQGETP
jgi:phosphoribosylanthranilate isomerase